MLQKRVLLPVVFAVLCAAGLLAFLWWQLHAAGRILSATATPSAFGGQSPMPSILNEPIDPRDTALLEMRRGDLAGLQGDYALAAEAYENAVDAGGGLPALRKLAQAQLQRRDIRAARLTLEQMRRAGARTEDVFLLSTIIELRTGELQKAKELLRTALDSPQKRYAAALIAIVENDHETAQTELKEVIGGWEPVLLQYAKTLQAAYDEYALFPESPETHLLTLLSRALAQNQECELALPLLSRVTAQQDDYRDAWIVQGYCELTTDRSEQAMASFERAYALDPEKPETQYFLARAYAQLGNHQHALTFFQYALKNGFTPESEVRRYIAMEAAELGDAQTALEQEDALTRLSDANIDTYAEYVAMAIRLGRNEEAYVKAKDATVRWSDDARAFDLLGQAAKAAGHTAEARTAWQEALKLNASLTSAREGLEKL